MAYSINKSQPKMQKHCVKKEIDLSSLQNHLQQDKLKVVILWTSLTSLEEFWPTLFLQCCFTLLRFVVCGHLLINSFLQVPPQHFNQVEIWTLQIHIFQLLKVLLPSSHHTLITCQHISISTLNHSNLLHILSSSISQRG